MSRINEVADTSKTPIKAPSMSDIANNDFLLSIQGLLQSIESEIKSNLTEFEGSDYIKEYVHKVFKDKEIKVYKDSERADGQELLVANEPWYVYNANYGTSEEKKFVELFQRRFEGLKEKFTNIYLIRNEREVKIIDKLGRAFEPDFVLFCKQKKGEELTYQVFIEPKGAHLIANDKWKEEFLKQIREEEKQAKIEKDFGSLDYDFYLVLKILNDTMGMLTAGTVTTILQQQFNKKPKWDEFAVLSKLRGLLSMGLALEDIQNSTEYFEISDYGEDVFKYLSEQESKGLYPKSKPTEQTVAVRPSPTESATLNSVGTIKKGNDGNNWEVKESSKGVKRWVKIK